MKTVTSNTARHLKTAVRANRRWDVVASVTIPVSVMATAEVATKHHYDGVMRMDPSSMTLHGDYDAAEHKCTASDVL